MSGPWEKYQATDTAGPWAKYGAPVAESPSVLQQIVQTAGNVAAGLVRGAGSIGATVLAPYDMAKDAIDGKGLSLESNRERRAGIDGGLQQLGAEPDSLAYQGGKLGGEIAGTAGVGSALGGGAKALGAAAPVVEALTTGGMRAGGVTGAPALALRTGAGAVTGGASGAAVNPEATGTGAIVGAALPGVVQGLGKAAQAAAGKVGEGGSPANLQKMATARAGADLGYVIPPVDLQPSFMTQLVSGLSGKIKTAQVASQRNQPVTDALARKAVGLDAAAELTPDALQAIRRQAGEAYEVVRGAGVVPVDDIYTKRIQQIGAVSSGAARSFPGAKSNGIEELLAPLRQKQFDAGDGIDMITNLRETADAAFRKGETALGRASKAAANALEEQIDRHLATVGDPDAVKAFQNARKLIAKTYTVQKAVNPSTGSVSAPRLAAELNKGRPLSDELASIAQMGNAFPKATQALKEAPGAVSPLDFLFASTGTGAASALSGFGAGATMGTAGLIARPIVRAALLSKVAQATALRQPKPPGPMSLMFEQAKPIAYRALPVLPANP